MIKGLYRGVGRLVVTHGGETSRPYLTHIREKRFFQDTEIRSHQNQSISYLREQWIAKGGDLMELKELLIEELEERIAPGSVSGSG